MILKQLCSFVDLWLWVEMLSLCLKKPMEKLAINSKRKCPPGKRVENLSKNCGEICLYDPFIYLQLFLIFKNLIFI